MKFRLIQKLASPNFTDKEKVQRQYILNILLLGSILLSLVALVHNIVTHVLNLESSGAIPPAVAFVFLLIHSFLLFLSWIGKIRLSAIILITFLGLSAIYTAVLWGMDVPQGLVIFALVIVMAGILIGARFLLFTTAVVMGALITLSLLQVYRLYVPDSSWRQQESTFGDAILLAVTLLIIAIVSWLFNREIEKASQRARASELALRRQRDLLEVKVEERTAELKRMQIEKMAQLYHFAEFGRISSGLFHDLVNPLQLISLNINKISSASKKRLSGGQPIEEELRMERVRLGIKKLESFIALARKQVQNQKVRQTFSLSQEIREVIQMLHHKALDERVRISFNPRKEIHTYGNPIKFQQVVMNLVSNAIDAYPPTRSRSKKRDVQVVLQKINNTIQLIVQDWGAGIEKKDLNKIFEPFFTTKGMEKGTGIGLSITRDIVEKDFRGTIYVASKAGEGTRFTVEFPMKEERKK